MDHLGNEWCNENLPSYCFMSQFMIIAFLMLLGLGSATAENKSPKLKVVASFSILGDFVRQIGGDDVEVEIIVPENADPHVYQSKPLDAKKLNQAELVIVNGLGFEGWLDRLITNSGYKGEVITASKTVKPRVGHNSQGSDVEDPHAWHNVKNSILYVTEIKQALQQKLPAQAATIEARANAYILRLQQLDQWVHGQFKEVDPKDRKVLTTHDAFAYFGLEYGLEFLSPVGISTDAEPSAAKVAELIKIIKSQNIKAIFIENFSFGKLVEQIAKEANAEVDGILYADSLSDPKEINAPAKTYIEMVQHNTIAIHKKLIS